MRKLLLTLLTVATALSAFASVASADQPGALQTRNAGPGGSYSTSCRTNPAQGVSGMAGAWGDFIDGCTTNQRIMCRAATCTVKMQTYIEAYGGGAPPVKVTQNARVRVFKSPTARQPFTWQDSSCSGTSGCMNTVTVTVKRKQSATAQCNGVKQHLYGEPGPPAYNWCSISMVPNPA